MSSENPEFICADEVGRLAEEITDDHVQDTSVGPEKTEQKSFGTKVVDYLNPFSRDEITVLSKKDLLSMNDEALRNFFQKSIENALDSGTRVLDITDLTSLAISLAIKYPDIQFSVFSSQQAKLADLFDGFSNCQFQAFPRNNR